ncbi:uncharacterized protein [Haliotis asinina]|uniref:uncharacterized protein n=1 Tax=Haliotis asinina TaxID=109174 RepID=UPI00353252E2
MKFAALLLLGLVMSQAQDRCGLISFLWYMNDVCHLSLLRYYVTLNGVLTQQDIRNTLNAVCSEVTEERLLCAAQRTSGCDNRDTLRSYAAVNGICTDDHPSQYAQQLLASLPPRVNATCLWRYLSALVDRCVELTAWRAAFGYNRTMTEADIFQHHQTSMNMGARCVNSASERTLARCVMGEGGVEGVKAALLLSVLTHAPPGFIYNITFITDVGDRH